MPAVSPAVASGPQVSLELSQACLDVSEVADLTKKALGKRTQPSFVGCHLPKWNTFLLCSVNGSETWARAGGSMSFVAMFAKPTSPRSTLPSGTSSQGGLEGKCLAAWSPSMMAVNVSWYSGSTRTAAEWLGVCCARRCSAVPSVDTHALVARSWK